MQDVIVVGAGPAGCAAAKILAERGYTVTIIERCKIPRNKSCSGILIGKTLNLVKEHFGDMPDSVTCSPSENRGMVFYDDYGKEFRFEQKGLNVWRSRFDAWLLEKAKEKGTNVLDGNNVISVENRDGFAEVAIANGKKLRARFVIDCSGAAGGLREERDFISTYQVFYRGECSLDPHYFYAFTDPRFSEYDAWYNVKDDMPVVGVAVKNPKNALQYHKKFVGYLKEKWGLRLEGAVREERWVMPCVRPPYVVNCGKGSVLNAGEAAGFLNPMGEGISAALESGVLAASAVAEHGDRAVAAYAKSVAELKDYMERQWELVAFLSERFKYIRGDN